MEYFVDKIICGYMENCYLYYCENKKCLIIDPGSDPEKIIEKIDSLNLKPTAILLTHGHSDHISALDELRSHYKIESYIHYGDQDFLMDGYKNTSEGYEETPVLVREAENIIKNDNLLGISNFQIQPIHTPGHTPGGVCYYDKANGVLFTGDTLFNCGIGSCDFYGGNHEQLIGSISNKLFCLPDETVVYPGHGMATTIINERTRN